MPVITKILLFFGNNIPAVSFIGAIVGGEETLVLLSILAAKGFLSIGDVFVFFYLGIMVSDILWYYAGKSRIFSWLIKIRFISKAYGHWGKLLNKATKENDFQALLITKFLYGFRLPTIMYLSRERLSLKSFLKYSLITDFVWTGTILSIGWLAGKGIGAATYFSNNIIFYVFLIGLVLTFFTILMRIISNKVKRWLEKK
ncbi:hypothetical protein A2442_00215 [Candidatus Campbellbacteria bacterium RIFOXYC2_FULL_35_25]|uniref:DedA family protein n=1 Tax=Candidatus Campbellbacteria bacterium RIFOXYC2_FULL_35_25 TaxID=1797582 RepID=A0A1F5EHM2_9BACT|nr:MAG: hypothetical protein A2442_00215 [Candidatus Campbellbacteria bacterium RIFOXYC2_FULL_35_25]